MNVVPTFLVGEGSFTVEGEEVHNLLGVWAHPEEYRRPVSSGYWAMASASAPWTARRCCRGRGGGGGQGGGHARRQAGTSRRALCNSWTWQCAAARCCSAAVALQLEEVNAGFRVDSTVVVDVGA